MNFIDILQQHPVWHPVSTDASSSFSLLTTAYPELSLQENGLKGSRVSIWFVSSWHPIYLLVWATILDFDHCSVSSHSHDEPAHQVHYDIDCHLEFPEHGSGWNLPIVIKPHGSFELAISQSVISKDIEAWTEGYTYMHKMAQVRAPVSDKRWLKTGMASAIVKAITAQLTIHALYPMKVISNADSW